MVCQSFKAVFGGEFNLVNFMIYPATCFQYFYALILFLIFLTLTATLFYKEEDETRRGDLLSSAGTSIIATIFLALIGTLIKSTNTDLVMITNDIFLYVVALSFVILGSWGYRNRR